MEPHKINIGSISLRGGSRDDFVGVLLQYYPGLGRSVVKGLFRFKSEHTPENDRAFLQWALAGQDLQELIVDLPLSTPPCQSCLLVCPGQENCLQLSVQQVRQQMSWILEQDLNLHVAHPKGYEQQRVESNLIDLQRSLFPTAAADVPLPRALKNKLKKGFLPYWHRPIDFWIWQQYHVPALKIFRTSYDSFGPTAGLLLPRFAYWRRHFPAHLRCHESSVEINLLELVRAKIIFLRELRNLHQFAEDQAAARLVILREVEKHLKIFIYQHDLEEMVNNVRAFDSFLLAIGGPLFLQNRHWILPAWALPEECHFVAPNFQYQMECGE